MKIRLVIAVVLPMLSINVFGAPSRGPAPMRAGSCVVHQVRLHVIWCRQWVDKCREPFSMQYSNDSNC